MKNGARDDLLVEFPEIFDAAAAARQNDEVECWPNSLGWDSSRMAVAISAAAPIPCTRTGLIRMCTSGRATSQHIQDVANRRAARRSDNADARGKLWERTLARGSEQSFRLQFALERLEFRLQQTRAARLHDLHAELVLAARFKNGNVAVNLDLRAVGKRHAQRRHRVAKNHAGDLRALILEREILMAARMQFVIRNFALHPDGAESRLQQSRESRGSAPRRSKFSRALEISRQFCHVERSRDISYYWEPLRIDSAEIPRLRLGNRQIAAEMRLSNNSLCAPTGGFNPSLR